MKNSLSNTEEQRSEISIVDVQLIDTDSRAVDFDTELWTDFANSYTVLYIFASFMLSSWFQFQNEPVYSRGQGHFRIPEIAV